MVKLLELPDEILLQFLQLLPGVEDHARFPAVCKAWRSVSLYKKSTKPFGPWLMLATLDNDKQEGDEGRVRICYSFHTNNLFRLSLPELQGRRAWGTPHGWLLTLGLDLQITLFHPFTRTTIALPPQTQFPCNETEYTDSHHVCETFITRVALSGNPSDSHPVVTMVVCTGDSQLSFAYPGDESWTHVITPRGISDIIFFAGNFYCMDGWGYLYVCDIKDTLHPTAQRVASRPKGLRPHNNSFYLVEISGRLYFIIRKWDSCEEHLEDPEDLSTLHTETRSFIAYEFDFSNKKWMDNVKDLKGYAVFLGNSTTCAISTLDHPELKANCIYFTDDESFLYSSQEGHYNDMGVYNFQEKTMLEPFYKITQSASKFSRPFFFTPTLK